MKKILSVVLAALMILSMSSAIFAGVLNPTVNANHGTTAGFGFGFIPEEEDEEETVLVIFVGEDNNELIAKEGTTTLEDGSVAIELVKGDFLTEDLIPENNVTGKFYEFDGYYVVTEEGDEEIDPLAYVFDEDQTYVYTSVADTWKPFSDMKQDRSDWYYQYVRDLSIAGIVNGYPDGTFNPQGNVKWGEALKLIVLATGYEAQAATDEHWASGYLAFAKENGFIDAEAEIDLDAAISRLDYATVAAKALKLEASEIETPFADTDDVYVLALYEAGIVEGSFDGDDRLFKPENNITRAEMSTVIWRINRLGK